MLGPTYSKDIVKVETSDHAKLNLKLSYNWKFEVDRNDQTDCKKCFCVRDFIGDMCNNLGSKVRAAIAGHTFDAFHKSSARIIRKAIFGVDENDHINDTYVFPNNNLYVINCDIISVEPEDRDT